MAEILAAWDDADVVCLGEGHGRRNDSDLRIALVRHPDFRKRVDAVVIEFANPVHQEILDRLALDGEPVPHEILHRVWRDASSPATWESPIYEAFLRAVREANLKVPRERRVRILGGDTPRDWSQIETAEQLLPYMNRGGWMRRNVSEQVLDRGLKALAIFGASHCRRKGRGFPGELQDRYRGRFWVALPLAREARGSASAAERLRVGDRPALVRVRGTWRSRIPAAGLFTRVDATTTIGELTDAILYFGDRPDVVVPADLSDVTEADLREKARRDSLRREASRLINALSANAVKPPSGGNLYTAIYRRGPCLAGLSAAGPLPRTGARRFESRSSPPRHVRKERVPRRMIPEKNMMANRIGRHSLVAAALAVTVAACVGPAPAGAQDWEAKSRRVDSLYAGYGSETPGVAIRVVQGGRVVHRGEYGMADLEQGVPISPSTVFAIGSNAKQFTGLAIAMLAEEGEIDLDEDVRTYVPDVPDFGEPSTVRQLLHHQSGIRDWVRPFFFAGIGTSITFNQVMSFLRRQKELNFAPGERYMYSNTGYVLLAEVVSRVTGTPFPEWMRENIFEPLGMTSTRVRARWFDLVEDYASSYYPAGDGYLSVYNGLAAYGSCCILSTTDDMVKWFRNFETAAVGGPEAIRAMVHDTVGIDEWDGRLVGYGYGLQHFRHRGHRGLFHSGQWAGFRSATLRVPSLELAIVVLGNPGPSADLEEWEVLEIYAEDDETAAGTEPTGTPAAEGGATEEAAETDTSLAELAVPVDPEVLDGYAGTYDLGTWDGSSEVLVVERDDDRLRIRFTSDREASVWTPVSRTEFKSRVDGPTLGFEVDADDRATAAVWRGRSWPRVEPFDPGLEELEQYAGTFYSDELETAWRFEVEDGERLVATQIRWGGTLALIPTVKDEFRGSSQVTRARFVRDATGSVTEVRVSGRRALEIRFVKLTRG